MQKYFIANNLLYKCIHIVRREQFKFKFETVVKMANSKLSNPLFCAAIDFGTTFTGLAFAEWGKGKTVAISWEHDGLEGIDIKAPTAVLFDSGRNFLAFGFEAVKRYSRMNDKQKSDCNYFERFKMELHHKEVSFSLLSYIASTFALKLMFHKD